MSEPFLGEIKIVGFNFPPRNWAKCDGQMLDISQNTALFSLFGTYYGGDGRTTFGLPDMRGRLPMHYGSGPGLSTRNIGIESGNETHNLNGSQLAPHTHTGQVVAATTEGDRTDPTGAFMARPEEPVQPYAGAGGANMAAGSVVTDSAGGGAAVNHMPPFCVMNFVVALAGLYPSRS